MTQSPKPRRADGNQKRRDGLEPSVEVVEAGRDQIAARKVHRFHSRMVPANGASDQTAALRQGWVFLPGHRIMVQVQSSPFPTGQ